MGTGNCRSEDEARAKADDLETSKHPSVGSGQLHTADSKERAGERSPGQEQGGGAQGESRGSPAGLRKNTFSVKKCLLQAQRNKRSQKTRKRQKPGLSEKGKPGR